MLKKDFGEIVRKFRLKKHWTQEDMSRELRCTVRTISRWELNQATPSYLALLKLEILGLDVAGGGTHDRL